MSSISRARRASTSLALAALASTALLAAANANPTAFNVRDRAATSGVTADALPTTQIDGVAWAQQIVGGTVYVGGDFANARPAGAAAGTSLTPRKNMLAYDLATGDLVASFQADTDAAVRALALSPDGSRLYVGGSFTSIQGQQHYRLAAIDTATGKVISSFAPVLDTTVNGIAVTNTAVYVGGGFSRANGVARNKLAAFDPATGNLLGWAPTVNAPVQTMVASPDQSRIIIGGTFSTVNGSTQQGSASLSAANGAVQPWAFNQVVRQGNSNAGIFSLSSDGRNIMATGFSYLQGMFEGAALIDPNTGKLIWMADCHGDSYGATATQGLVYVASHEHNCDNINSFPQQDNVYHHANAFTYDATTTVRHNSQIFYTDYYGNPAPTQIDWFPTMTPGTYTGQNQAAWDVTSNDQYVVYGGEFTKVNGTAQQGLVRFAVPALAPRKSGPVVGGAEMTPTAKVSGNQVTLTWQTSWDRDNENLTYEVHRDTKDAVVGRVQSPSLFWDRPTVSFTDTGLNAGQTYTYWVTAVDPDGNTSRSNNVTVTSAPPTASSVYTAAVLASTPRHYWRLGETSGNQMADLTGGLPLTNGIGVGRNQPGAISDDKASWFDGALGGWAYPNTTEAATNDYSAELWFKTSSGSGGELIGMGSQQRYVSTTVNRTIYLTNDGRVAYGVTGGGATKAVTSTSRYNDNQWHHVVSALSAEGMKLYVDGQLVASDATVTSGDPQTGYWRLGGDNTAGLPNRPAATYTNVTLDEVALYPHALTAAQVQAHFQARR